ncbi:MAG: asparaginase [Hydrogenophaga sp.]|uniref:asparaginase n=1 Tax=Hydrogenophaga sp. TaxID=1904254 RepID=UPI0027313A09|nr:asparaginase [Hydrogenophaga sp.]MDP2163022.1 asparaginase [Hydrogenophaga sp.]
MKNKKIVILGTGGTIAGTAAEAGDNLGYTAAQVGIGQLVAALPALTDSNCELLSEQVAQVDSKDMDFGIWRALAQRVAHWLAQDEVQGIVITHGTDTLEETAFFLQAVLDPAKPVVLTCAMRPATALAPDGPQNMLDAVAVASHAGARGVVAVCAGVIHGAVDVQKVHTYRLDAFSSGDAGPLGFVEEGRLRLLRNWPSAHAEQAQAAIKTIASSAVGQPWPRVEIVMNYAGADGRAVRALVADGVQGLVVAGTGNGALHHALEAVVLEAQAQGVRVVRATRCLEGRVLPKAGDVLPDSQGLSPVKARVALMLALLASDH